MSIEKRASAVVLIFIAEIITGVFEITSATLEITTFSALEVAASSLEVAFSSLEIAAVASAVLLEFTTCAGCPAVTSCWAFAVGKVPVLS